MAKMTIVGHAAYQRKNNRIAVPVINVGFRDESYATIDWGLGGFRIAEYEGELKLDEEFVVDGIGPGDQDELLAVRIESRVARRLDDQLSVAFITLSGDAYDILEALMMRRKKFLEKLKMKSR